jgi:hypothetical protein
MTAQRTLTAPDARTPDDQLILDLASLRVLKVPEVSPPFDREVLPDDVLSSRQPAPASSPGPRSTKPGPAAGGRASGRPSDQTVARDDWPQRFARLLVETLAGARPARQLVPWTTERSRSHIRKLTPALGAGQRPRVLRVLTSHPGPGVAEMTVIVGIGPRIRALAVRLEQTARTSQPARRQQTNRWICTDVEAA